MLVSPRLAGLSAFVLWASVALAQSSPFAAGAPGFTAVQAERGAELYAANCMSCHGANLAGGQFGPPLRGEAFQANWQGQSAEALFAYIEQSMPPGGAGNLNRAAYADIFAHMLRENGVPPGEVAFAPEGAVMASTPPPEARNESPFRRPDPNYDAVYQDVVAKRSALLQAMSPVTEEMLRSPPAADWLMWRRDYTGQGFGALEQITADNVAQLEVGWSRSLPVSLNEITPLVHDGIIFVHSGASVQALDATSGDRLWEHVRTFPDAFNNGRTTRSKGMAMLGDTLFMPMVDGHMVALDARTGEVRWDHQIITDEQRAQGVQLNGVPIVADGKVVMGVTLSIGLPGGCYIVALDPATGEEVWRFHTLARPGQPGGDSWNGVPVEDRFGGALWTGGSYDPELNLIYFGVGNTYDTTTLLQNGLDPGPENAGAYTAATVAIKADSGELAWYYQHMVRDVWDMDWAFEQTLMDLERGGETSRLVVTGGKLAIFDAVDRATGDYAFSVDAGFQNLVSHIDPETGDKHINPELYPEANVTKLLCPGSGGTRNWPSTSYNPGTGVLFVPMVEACADFTWVPRTSEEAGGIDQRFRTRPHPDNDGMFGRVEAIDLATGRPVWSVRRRAPNSSSMLATAGGVLFNGARDRFFTAYDQADGEILWQLRLNAQASASPITYAVDGVQYIAVVAGGGNPQDTAFEALTPEITNPTETITLWTFRLGGEGGTGSP